MARKRTGALLCVMTVLAGSWQATNESDLDTARRLGQQFVESGRLPEPDGKVARKARDAAKETAFAREGVVPQLGWHLSTRPARTGD